MTQEAREWIGLLVAVFVGMAFVSLLIWIRAQDQEKGRTEALRALGFIWGAVALTLAGGWVLHQYLGGPVFDVQSAGGFRLVVRSLTGPQIAAVCALLGLLVGLYVTALLVVRRLLGGAVTGAGQIATRPTERGDQG